MEKDLERFVDSCFTRPLRSCSDCNRRRIGRPTGGFALRSIRLECGRNEGETAIR